MPVAELAEDLKPEGWDLQLVSRETPEQEVVSQATDADFVLIGGPGVSDDVLRAGKNIRLVQLCSAGFDGVNTVLAGELGIPVANNGGANAIPVAEFALTLMLSTLRHAVIADQDTRAGGWMRPELDGRDTWELTEAGRKELEARD